MSMRHSIYNNDRIGIFKNQGCPDILIDELDEEELAIRRPAAAQPVASGRRGFCKESNQGREGIVLLEALHEVHRMRVPCFIRMKNVAVAPNGDQKVSDQKLPCVECLGAFC